MQRFVQGLVGGLLAIGLAAGCRGDAVPRISVDPVSRTTPVAPARVLPHQSPTHIDRLSPAGGKGLGYTCNVTSDCDETEEPCMEVVCACRKTSSGQCDTSGLKVCQTTVPKGDGSTCNDRNDCTVGDHCQQGACGGIRETTAECGFEAPTPPPGDSVAPLRREQAHEVGTMAGTFAVNAQGAATYSMPFVFPPGRNGMTPTMGLAYSSDQGNGMVGMGFSLTGLSSIQRCPKNRAMHYSIKEVDFEKDNLCLDGQQLMEIVQNGRPVEYRTIPDTFQKIIPHYEEVDPNQPSWFEVIDRSGISSFYGWDGRDTNDRNARPRALNGAFRYWMIHTRMDRYTNHIKYNYSESEIDFSGTFPQAEEPYLQSITYSPSNILSFEYESRNDRRNYFSKGLLIERNKRLKRVQAFADANGNASLVRVYQLSYDMTVSPSNRSRVSEVRECVPVEESVSPNTPLVCKPSTVFTWNHGVAGFTEKVDQGSVVMSKASAIFPIDLDRDGLDDLVVPDTASASGPTNPETGGTCAKNGSICGDNKVYVDNYCVTKCPVTGAMCDGTHTCAEAPHQEPALSPIRYCRPNGGFPGGLVNACGNNRDCTNQYDKESGQEQPHQCRLLCPECTSECELYTDNQAGCPNGYRCFRDYEQQPMRMFCAPMAPNNPNHTTSQIKFFKGRLVDGTQGDIAPDDTKGGTIQTSNPINSPLFLPFDYNGDKIPDLLMVNDHSFLNSDNEYTLTALKGPDYSIRVNTTLPRSSELNASKYLNGGVHLVDLDGNGFADLVQCKALTSPTAADSRWSYRLHKGTEPGPGSTHSFDFPKAIPELDGVPCSNLSFPIDLNGDGVSEYLIYTWSLLNPSSPPKALRLKMEGPYGTTSNLNPVFEHEVVSTNLSLPNLRDMPVVADVNGDGLQDLVFASGTYPYDPSQSPPAQPVAVRLNMGNGQFTPEFVDPGFTIASTLLAMSVVVDYNGDGLADLLVPHITSKPNSNEPDIEGARWQAWISEGHRFSIVATNIEFEGRTQGFSQNELTWQLINDPNLTVRYQNYRAADFNGDGFPDLVGVDKHGTIVTRQSTLNEQDTLLSVDDGLRYRDPGEGGYVPGVTITYAHLIDGNGVYSKTPDPDCKKWIWNCVAGSKRVVRTYRTTNGHDRTEEDAPLQNQYSLSYHDARYFVPGSQWVGFAELARRHQRLGIESDADEDALRVRREYFSRDIYEYGFYDIRLDRVYSAARGQTTFTAQGEFIEWAVKYAWMPDDTNFTRPSFFSYPRVHRTWSGQAPSNGPFSAEPGGMMVNELSYSLTTIDEIDTFGNRLAVAAHSGPFSSVTTTSYLNDTNSWLIGRPARISRQEISSELSSPALDTLVTELEYDFNGYLKSTIVDPNIPDQWQRTSLWRDQYGNVTGVISQNLANDVRSSWTFFDADNWYPYARSNALGQVSYETYDRGLGVLAQVTDPNGVTVSTIHDGFGRPVRVVRPDGVETFVDRQRVLDGELGSWLTRVNVSAPLLGHAQTSFYNNLAQVHATERRGFSESPSQADWYYTAYEYDTFGEYASAVTQPSSEFNGYSHQHRDALMYQGTYRFKRDLSGRPIEQADPAGNTSLNIYDTAGRSYSVDPTYNVTITSTGQAGQITSVEDAMQGKTHYTHGPFGATHIQTPGESTPGTQLVTDRRGRIVLRTDPDRGVATYEYNAFDELVRETQGSSYVLTYTYDELGRPTRKVVEIPGTTGAQETTDWRWDESPHGVGKLSWMITHEGHREDYAYDAIGRLDHITTTPVLPGAPSGSTPTPYTTSFAYQDGRLHAIRYPQGPNEPELTVYHQYSPDGSLVALYASDGGPGRSELLWKWTGVDLQGRLQVERTGDGLDSSYRYDPLTGLLRKLETRHPDTSTVLQSLEYDYDPAYNLIAQQDDVHSQNERFSYDSLHRLTSAHVNQVEATNFDYLANGNIQAIWKTSAPSQGPPTTSPWEYDPAHPHAVSRAYRDSSANEFRFLSDNLGRQWKRITPSGTRYLGYTSFHKPKWIAPTNSATDAQAVQFSYDGADRRLLKDSLASRTLYVQGLYEKTTTKATGRSVLRRHVSNGTRVVATVVHNDASGPHGTTTWTGATHFVHSDRLGSPTLITDANGAVEERRSYDPFGRRRSHSNWTQPAGPLLTPLTAGFTGHEDEEELGLTNMQGRIYDPQVARFLTPDPTIPDPLFSQAWNRYAYVFNSPLNFVDPSGFVPITVEDEPGPNGYGAAVRGNGQNGTPAPSPPPTPAPTPTPAPAPNSDSPLGSSKAPAHIDTGSFDGSGPAPSPTLTTQSGPLERLGMSSMGAIFGFGQGLIPGAGFAREDSFAQQDEDFQRSRALGEIIGGLTSAGGGLAVMGGGVLACDTGLGCLLAPYAAKIGAGMVLNGGTGVIKGADGLRQLMSGPMHMAGKGSGSSGSGGLPEIRGTQTGFRDPDQISRIKQDMLEGNFRFQDPGGQIAGIVDELGRFHITEGHHRMTAAQEIFKETGDSSHIRNLLNNGHFRRAPAPPDSRPMPSRSFWGNLRNKIGF